MTFKRSYWSLPYFIFLAVFVVLPLILIGVYAFQDGSGHFSFSNITRFFTDPDAVKREQDGLDREKRRQQAILDIRKKYGKNAILKGMNFREGATTIDRNNQIGGHKA